MVNLSITEAINFLKEKNFNAYFEGDICVKMMPLTLEDVENNGELETLKQEIDFIQRPNKEKLLRLIIYQLFEMEYIDKHKSIIDVGCCIGDNAIRRIAFTRISFMIRIIIMIMFFGMFVTLLSKQLLQ